VDEPDDVATDTFARRSRNYHGSTIPGAAQRVLDALGCTVAHRWMGRALARAFHQAGLRDIVAEPRPIALPPAIHRQLVAPALAAAVEAWTLEAHAYQHWLVAAQDAERGGYHSDTFVGMVVSARKPEPGRAAIAR
jgi:hypothetical protein